MLANEIAKNHDIVANENLLVANMTRSARGTSEQPGTQVAAKQGLNRNLADVAPGRQRDEIEQACIRHGAVYQRVRAKDTIITCSQCRAKSKKSRISQSEFCCTSSGYAANADGNAAENIRRRGVAELREHAQRRLERRQKKRAESTVQSTESGPGNGGAATTAATSANGSGRRREKPLLRTRLKAATTTRARNPDQVMVESFANPRGFSTQEPHSDRDHATVAFLKIDPGMNPPGENEERSQ